LVSIYVKNVVKTLEAVGLGILDPTLVSIYVKNVVKTLEAAGKM